MKKQKRYLFCSFGNIMQRHFRNLKQLMPSCLIDVFKTTDIKPYRIFDNELNLSFSNNLLEIYEIDNLYYNIDEALSSNEYEAIFVGTLPPHRIDIASKLATLKNNLFIEKPLSHNLDGIYKLRDIIEERNLKCAIGFQMRFLGILQKIKNMVENNEFGQIYRVEINHSNSIYNWTQGRDLGDFYALKNREGGGVLLTQLIHEIDYSFWLFGKHYPISAIYGNRLGFDVEDNISIMSNLEIDGYHIPINMNLDFLSKEPKRDITIYGTEKMESFDLLDTFPLSWNDLFMEEIRAFIDSLCGQWQQPLAELEDGISSLEFCMDVKNNFTDIRGM